MSDFKAKMYQIQFRLGLCPRPRWGSLQHSPRPPCWIKGPTSKGRGRGGEGMRPHPFTPTPQFIFLRFLDMPLTACKVSSLLMQQTTVIIITIIISIMYLAKMDVN